jgi:hypothetical protein
MISKTDQEERYESESEVAVIKVASKPMKGGGGYQERR